jgi:hypothetical protein
MGFTQSYAGGRLRKQKAEKECGRRVILMNHAILANIGDFLTGTAGTIAWNVCVFIAGAAVGPSVWNWLKKYLPWNK